MSIQNNKLKGSLKVWTFQLQMASSSSSLAEKEKRHGVSEENSVAFCLRIFSREDLKDGKKVVNYLHIFLLFLIIFLKPVTL